MRRHKFCSKRSQVVYIFHSIRCLFVIFPYIHPHIHTCMHEHLLIVYFSKDMYIIPMNISSIKWEGSRHAIFCFMHLQRHSFRGSLTLLYSDFRVVAEICPDLFRFLQCSHDPGCSYPQPLIIWSKMPRVGAQPPKRNPALCHVKFWRHAQGRWANHLFAFLHFVPNAAQCQPWPFNVPFWNSVGYLYDSQVPTIKWLASTFQPTMKLAIEPAPAILLGWNCLESWEFNPITSFILGWWVEASHFTAFIVYRFGKLCK